VTGVSARVRALRETGSGPSAIANEMGISRRQVYRIPPPDAATFEAWMMLGNPIQAVHTGKKLADEIQAHPHPVTLVQNVGKGKNFVPSPDASRHLTAMLRQLSATFQFIQG
jgi:hypothetical protein